MIPHFSAGVLPPTLHSWFRIIMIDLRARKNKSIGLQTVDGFLSSVIIVFGLFPAIYFAWLYFRRIFRICDLLSNPSILIISKEKDRGI